MDPKQLNKTLSLMPLSKKILILILIIIVFCLGGYYYCYRPKKIKISIIEQEINKLQKDLNENLEITKGIEDIEKEVEKIKKTLLEAQAQLPTEKEIPTLLAKISDLGSMVGLEFLLFKPKAEVSKDFYNEVPIDINIKGNYHTVVQFFDLIAHLPRIVNISNIIMKNPTFLNNTMTLETGCKATTFRFTAKTLDAGNSQK